jgi:hypothetical protein
MDNPNSIWIVVGLAVIAMAVALSLLFARRARVQALRARFGPERVGTLSLHDLPDADRQRFSSQWLAIQGQFVDDPRAPVARANALIKDVMRARGYSAGKGFDERAAELSVEHPDATEHYRAARALAESPAYESASTEQLRQAVVHYRVVFADLLAPATLGVPGALRPAHA